MDKAASTSAWHESDDEALLEDGGTEWETRAPSDGLVVIGRSVSGSGDTGGGSGGAMHVSELSSLLLVGRLADRQRLTTHAMSGRMLADSH